MKKLKLNRSLIICLIVTFGITGLLAVFTYKDYILPASEQPYDSIHLEPYVSEPTTPLMTEKQELHIRQNFTSSSEIISGFVIPIDTQGRDNKNEIKVSLYSGESEKLIQTWDLTGKVTPDTENLVINLDEPLVNSEGLSYELAIDEKDVTSSNQICFISTQKNRISTGQVIMNDQVQTGDLCFSVMAGQATNITKVYIVFAVWVCICVLILIFAIYKQKSLSKLFVCFGLLIGTIYLLVIPAYSAPDEDAHIMSAYELSNKMLFQRATDAEGIVLVREEDNALFYEGISLTKNSYVTLWNHIMKPTGSEKMIPGTRSALYTPFYTYLAPAIGITIARLFHLNNVWLLFLARFMSLLSFLLLTAFGIKYIPFHKMTMFFVGMLPMTISIAASCSYDVLNNGVSFAFIGYVLYMAYGKDILQKKDWIIITLLLAIMAPIKVVYVLLGLLCFLIPKEKLKKRWPYGLQRGIVVCLAIIMVFISRIASIVDTMQGGALAEATSTNMITKYSLSFVLQHPIHVAAVFVRTVIEMSSYYFTTMIGESLGAFRIAIPEIVVWGYLLVGFFVIILSFSEKIRLKPKDRVFVAFVSLITIFGVSFALLLSWTSTESTVINGIQGRYFLPILPIILMVFQSNYIQVKKNYTIQVLSSLLMLQIVTCFEMVKSIMRF